MDTDIKPIAADLYFLPVKTRVPLKFGTEVLEFVSVARVKVTIQTRQGKTAAGWGETPLSAQWAWPSVIPLERRIEAMKSLCRRCASLLPSLNEYGHPIELGSDFLSSLLPEILKSENEQSDQNAAMPWLSALICSSAFDIAIHDAYGNLLELDVYNTYEKTYMNRDLAAYLTPASDFTGDFAGLYPSHFLVSHPAPRLVAWHLVGGKDPVTEKELTGEEPKDNYPILLKDWIVRDGLTCLKIKLTGTDADWDYQRMCSVGDVAENTGVLWLTADFNCTVTDPQYVTDILDRLVVDRPRLYGMLLYVEQPFPYDLEEHQIDVHAVSARKPLFMDESAHDWSLVKLGRQLGWTGVALKTCKTQTGALLSLCWAKAHGMTLMVQDLTNPMLAQIPHVRLAAHAGTIMGVETNAMQFYPEASLPEAAVHPGLYTRTEGGLDLGTLQGSGFGYRVDAMSRALPDPEMV